MSSLKLWFLLLLIAVFCLTLYVPLTGQLSPVYNEYGRLASGQINIVSSDFSPFHVNPPLPNMLGALPSVLLNAEYATPSDLGYSHFGRSEYKANLVFVQKNLNHRELLTLGRIISVALFSVIGIFFCYVWSCSLSSYCPAFIAGLLWIFSPFIIGHGTLISPDVPSASLAVASIYFFWRWLKRPEMLEGFIAGIILGLAELTKFTLLIFYPLFIFIWLIYRLPEIKTLGKKDWYQQFKQLVIMFIISVVIINMGYLFEGTGKFLGSYRFQTTLFTCCKTLEEVPSNGGNRFEKTPFAYIPMPLPSNYIQGIDTQRLDFERGLPSY
ncbi:MAG: glycosyltransferase family 39 protein, partial [Planctomycetaceae bacterium]|nr:glycosyltransferase family 39 protein [Planctomycetaceae bacterium]